MLGKSSYSVALSMPVRQLQIWLALKLVLNELFPNRGNASSRRTLEQFRQAGDGTTFNIYLPSMAGSGPEPAEQARQGQAPQGSETLLLVEDEPSVRMLLARVLRAKGYDVMEASSGAEALALVAHAERPIQLVITDVVMPQMSGRALVEQVPSIRPQIKAIYISGYTDDALLRQGIMESEVHFLRKPFPTAEFVQKVRDVLDSR